MGKQLLASQDILVQRGFRVARVALQGASIGTRCLRPVTHLDVDITEIDQLLIPGRVLSCRRGISFPCQSQIVARFARTQRHKGIAMPKLSLVITPCDPASAPALAPGRSLHSLSSSRPSSRDWRRRTACGLMPRMAQGFSGGDSGLGMGFW